jgi:uncharacterized alpha-E superfamily protein
MLSRVANSIYWMSRYLERAENIARFIDVNIHLMLDLPGERENQWEPLVKATSDTEYFKSRFQDFSKEEVLEFLTLDPDYTNSIYSCVRAARENARSIREIISTEMWEQVNRFYHLLQEPLARKKATSGQHEFYSEIKTYHQLFTGLCEGTMSHGEAWHFMSLGRMLERADKTSRILDVKYFILLPGVDYVGSVYDNLQWAALLKSTSALEMYRKEFQRITPNHVAGFLILDQNFPRSVRHCLAQAEYSLHRITGTPLGAHRNAPEQKLGKLRSELEYANIEEIIEEGLHEFLDRLQINFNNIGNSIFETFFTMKCFSSNASREVLQ